MSCFPGYDEIDWAATGAWAQAWVTGIAIFASVWLQDRVQRKREAAAQADNRRGARALLQVLMMDLGTISARLVGDEGEAFVNSSEPQNLLRQRETMMLRFPVQVLQHARLIQLFAEASGYLRSALAQVDGVTRTGAIDSVRDEKFERARYAVNLEAEHVGGTIVEFDLIDAKLTKTSLLKKVLRILRGSL